MTTPRLGPAVVAVAAAALLLAAVAWWLVVDRQVPDFDSGKHLLTTWAYADYLRAGDLTEPFSAFRTYPPLVHMVGAVGALIGGVGVATPIVTVALVFVPLMVVGLYRAGTLLGDRWTGALAVVFAVGTPMIVTMFRAYLLEAALTALLAATVWLVIESRRLERVGLSVLAGLATGCGMLAKQPFAFFVAGFLAIVLLRGGWRHPRGLVAFAATALVVAAPWYLVHWDELQATSDWTRGPNAAGPIWSGENLSWYVWDILNRQLLLPLAALAALGALVSSVRFTRTRDPDDYTPELIAGGLVGWAALTFYLHLKSPYYSLPLTVYAALLGSIWIARLSPRARRLAAAALVVFAVINFAVAATWIGEPVRVALTTAKDDPGAVDARHVTLVSPTAWPATLPPGEHADVLELMRGLRGGGVEVLEFDVGTDVSYFNATGLSALAAIAGLARPPVYDPTALKPPREAFMGREPIAPEGPPPCAELGDGSAVFVTIGPPLEGRRICPAGG